MTLMRGLLLVLICTVGTWALSVQAAPRFVPVHVYIDSDAPLAAWQFEFSTRDPDTGHAMQVVGVENGDGPGHREPPYYDREAVASGTADRLIVAHYSLLDQSQLPVGNTRVATLHVMVDGIGDPEFVANLIVATTPTGANANAVIRVELAAGSEQ